MVTYRKVPKVTTLVTFGFGTVLLSLLLSGGRYFRMAKTSTSHAGHFQKKNLQEMWKEYVLKKGNVILYFKSYE